MILSTPARSKSETSRGARIWLGAMSLLSPAQGPRRAQQRLVRPHPPIARYLVNCRSGKQMATEVTEITRLLVADDHDLFRVGLASALATYEDIEVVAQASGGRMAVRLAAELRPDVILMDLRMPDLDGFEATRQILEADPSARVVALTVASGEADVAAAITAGASGYLIKDSPIDDVITAIRAPLSGTAWLSPRA